MRSQIRTINFSKYLTRINRPIKHKMPDKKPNILADQEGISVHNLRSDQ